MKVPTNWRRPITKADQPRDDGRGRLTSPNTGQEALNLDPQIPHGIVRFHTDRSYGNIDGSFNSEWPVNDSWVVIPHLLTPRGIVPARIAGRTFDDSVNVASAFVGNPQG